MKSDGFSLLETMVGLSLLLVVAAGMMPLATVAFSVSENQGHLASRAAEYAQDKLEQLMALSYGDTASDTRVFPATDVGGSGLTIGGSSNPQAPVAQYVDYLDVDGALIPSANGAPPQRVGSIASYWALVSAPCRPMSNSRAPSF